MYTHLLLYNTILSQLNCQLPAAGSASSRRNFWMTKLVASSWSVGVVRRWDETTEAESIGLRHCEEGTLRSVHLRTRAASVTLVFFSSRLSETQRMHARGMCACGSHHVRAILQYELDAESRMPQILFDKSLCEIQLLCSHAVTILLYCSFPPLPYISPLLRVRFSDLPWRESSFCCLACAV